MRLQSLLLLLICLIGAPPPSIAQDIPFFKFGQKIDSETWYKSHGWANGEHQSCEWRKHAVSGTAEGLNLNLSERGGKHRPYGCGEIRTIQKYSYGRYEARLKSAAGSGLNSAFFTFIGPHSGSPEHDEIDFEFLGKDPYIVEVTYFRNSKKGRVKRVVLGFDASQEFHDYAFEWSKTAIRWYVDGKLVHETDPGENIPIHPQQIFFSLWSNNESLNDWMGPFRYSGPVDMDIQWVRFTSSHDKKQDTQ